MRKDKISLLLRVIAVLPKIVGRPHLDQCAVREDYNAKFVGCGSLVQGVV